MPIAAARTPEANERAAPPLRAVAKIESLDDRVRRFAECRVLGHEWSHASKPLDDGRRPPMGVDYNAIPFSSSCRQCGASRTKWIGRSGSSTQAAYRYAEGYQRRGPEERLSATEWRRAWIVTALGERA